MSRYLANTKTWWRWEYQTKWVSEWREWMRGNESYTKDIWAMWEKLMFMHSGDILTHSHTLIFSPPHEKSTKSHSHILISLFMLVEKNSQQFFFLIIFRIFWFDSRRTRELCVRRTEGARSEKLIIFFLGDWKGFTND